MPQKKGSKPIWVDGAIHAALKERLKAEGWTWGMTKKVESLLSDYVQGKLTREQLSGKKSMALAVYEKDPHQWTDEEEQFVLELGRRLQQKFDAQEAKLRTSRKRSA